MAYWRSQRFWVAYVAWLVPSLFAFAVPGALFIDAGTSPVKATGILIGQETCAFLVPWLLARSAIRRGIRRGFPIVPRTRGRESPK